MDECVNFSVIKLFLSFIVYCNIILFDFSIEYLFKNKIL